MRCGTFPSDLVCTAASLLPACEEHAEYYNYCAYYLKSREHFMQENHAGDDRYYRREISEDRRL